MYKILSRLFFFFILSSTITAFAQDRTFRIATWNVRGGPQGSSWPQTDRVLQAIDNAIMQGTDIMALQEVSVSQVLTPQNLASIQSEINRRNSAYRITYLNYEQRSQRGSGYLILYNSSQLTAQGTPHFFRETHFVNDVSDTLTVRPPVEQIFTYQDSNNQTQQLNFHTWHAPVGHNAIRNVDEYMQMVQTCPVPNPGAASAHYVMAGDLNVNEHSPLELDQTFGETRTLSHPNGWDWIVAPNATDTVSGSGIDTSLGGLFSELNHQALAGTVRLASSNSFSALSGQCGGDSSDRIISALDGFNACGTEGESKYISSPTDVAYGVAGKYNFKLILTGNVSFNNEFFKDPFPGVYKNAYCRSTPNLDGWVRCANEGQSIKIVGKMDVRYGTYNHFVYKYGVTGKISFDNTTFGDPIPYVVKEGYCRPSESITIP